MASGIAFNCAFHPSDYLDKNCEVGPICIGSEKVLGTVSIVALTNGNSCYDDFIDKHMSEGFVANII